MKSVILEAAKALAEFVKEHEISFLRGDIVDFFCRLGPIHQGITATPVPPPLSFQSLLLKNMLSLWILVIDDDIDRKRSSTELNTSLKWLADYSLHRELWKRPRGAAALPNAMIQNISSATGQASDAFLLDLHMILAGFSYESIANRALQISNSQEFTRISTLTCGVIGFMDIDIALSGTIIETQEYRRLRAACDHFANATKFSQDVGTVDRDILQEQNDSLVTIHALESGLESPLTQAFHDGRLTTSISHVRHLAQSAFRNGVEILRDPRNNLDYDGVISTVAKVVQAEEDWFPKSGFPTPRTS